MPEPPATHNFSMRTGHIIALYPARSIQQQPEWGNSQDFPWVSATLKIPTTHEELDGPSAADWLLREGFSPQQSPSWNMPEARAREESNPPSSRKKIQPLTWNSYSLWPRHKIPRGKVTPWPQKSWSCPKLEAGSPLPWHPLFPHLLTHFVPLLISCFKNKKSLKQPKCRN